LYFAWLGFSKRGRLAEIRRAIRAREIVVATKGRTPSQREILIGLVHGSVHNDPISAGPLLYITSLYVADAFRRQGVASSLLHFIISRGVRRWTIQAVEVATVSKTALKFYRKLGFRQFKQDIGEILVQLDTEQWTPRD
jgi:ribosomal protein S18 acetylase RimI-like enzyme